MMRKLRRRLTRRMIRIIKFLLIAFFTALINSMTAHASTQVFDGNCWFAEDYTTSYDGYQIEFVRGVCDAGTKFRVYYNLSNAINRANQPTTYYISIGSHKNVWPPGNHTWNDISLYDTTFDTTIIPDFSYFDFSGNFPSHWNRDSFNRLGKGSFTAYQYMDGMNTNSTSASFVANTTTGFALTIYTGYIPGNNINTILTSKTNVQNELIINSQNENQRQTNERLDETNRQLDETNDTLKDSNVNGANDTGSSFFSNFESNDHGLSAIITAPLEMIRSITSSTCTPLHLPIPFVDQTIDLPCMSTIYQTHFSSFLTLYQTITFGIVAYWVCVNIFGMVKGFKDPETDRIEVLDL